MQIYKITNLMNNKIYIGQQYKDRPTYLGSGKLIRQAILKYGKENFKKEVLQKCNSTAELDKYEIYWIKELDATNREIGYNISEGGKVNRTMRGENNPTYGKKFSEETKQKMSKAKKGKKYEEIYGIEGAKIKKTNVSNTLKIFYSDPLKLQKVSERTSGEKNGMYGVHRYGKDNPMYGVYRRGKDAPFYGKKQPTAICIYCGKEYSKTNIIRWHNERCKLKAEK